MLATVLCTSFMLILPWLLYPCNLITLLLVKWELEQTFLFWGATWSVTLHNWPTIAGAHLIQILKHTHTYTNRLPSSVRTRFSQTSTTYSTLVFHVRHDFQQQSTTWCHPSTVTNKWIQQSLSFPRPLTPYLTRSSSIGLKTSWGLHRHLKGCNSMPRSATYFVSKTNPPSSSSTLPTKPYFNQFLYWYQSSSLKISSRAPISPTPWRRPTAPLDSSKETSATVPPTANKYSTNPSPLWICLNHLGSLPQEGHRQPREDPEKHCKIHY